MPEIIEEFKHYNSNNMWQPFAGDETLNLLINKGFGDKDSGSLNETGSKILSETTNILRLCVNPAAANNSETGIVIGYVQSGKTLSFTTLTALARDNDFRIIIIIAGTSVNLVNQSTNRLKDDLRLDKRDDRKWTLLSNPSTQEHKQTIKTVLAQWNDKSYSNDRCRTVLITVMKQKDNLLHLIEILEELDLDGAPVLIIDDEGDQASLNTTAKKLARENADLTKLSETEVSTIYRRITRLRSAIPHHTFLQYTATPQANLFINIVDRLSPNFIKLLTPGSEYTGGKEFFIEKPDLIKEIPLLDIPSANNILTSVPESLIRALKVYFLGVAAGNLDGGKGNRTMMIHPSRLQQDHKLYYGWVRGVCQSWQRLLDGDDEEEKKEFIKDFVNSYNDLKSTVGSSLPDFAALTGTELLHAIKYTQIVEVNSRRGATPPINWKDVYSWILVGGQSMDRGFTVEGLTVTYMPRNLGVGNVDTVQQRARFFGYKRSYIGYCRIFLDQDTIDFYNSIVEHEENVRQSLLEFDVNNKHLDDWNRSVVLDRMLKLTRTNVLYDALQRDRLDGWFKIKAPHDTESLIETNRINLFSFLKEREWAFQPDEGHNDRTTAQRHLVAAMSTKEVLDELLNKLKFTRDSDSAGYSILRSLLSDYVEKNPNDECLVYLMSARGVDDWSSRERSFRKNKDEVEIHQGANSKRGVITYPGDAKIKQDGLLTIQVHLINISNSSYNGVPTLGIWVPGWLGVDTIRQ